jgi:hypothetical protein
MTAMDATSISQYIAGAYEDVQVATSDGNSFFFDGPFSGGERKFPFATLVTNDMYDQFSDLSRPSVYRLNLGVSKETFGELFGSDTAVDDLTATFDFKALNVIMPHPVYGRMKWICILSPDEETFQNCIRPLIAEAYELSSQRYKKSSTAE